jgi:hypothetical protein
MILAAGRHAIHDPGHVGAVAHHLVLKAVPVGVQANRALRGVAVVLHEVVARNPLEVLLQVRVVELRAGVYDGHGRVLAQAGGGRARQAERGGRVILGIPAGVAYAQGVVSAVPLMVLGRFGDEIWLGVQQAGIVHQPPHHPLRVRTGRRLEKIDAIAAREFVEGGQAVIGVDLSMEAPMVGFSFTTTWPGSKSSPPTKARAGSATPNNASRNIDSASAPIAIERCDNARPFVGRCTAVETEAKDFSDSQTRHYGENPSASPSREPF